MRKIVQLLILVAICTLLLSGCWNRRELNELSISLAMGIDKEGDEFVVTHQVVNPSEVAGSQGGGAGGAPVTLYQGKGKTVFQASRKITKEAPRKIYAAHIRVLVIGEAFAKEGMAKALDFVSRGQEFRTDFHILLVRDGKAADALRVLTPLETIPANEIFDTLETSERAWSSAGTIQLDELINDLVSKGRQPFLTGIQIMGNKPDGNETSNLEAIDVPTRITVGNLAVFKGDKLIGWLSEDESKGHNYVTGRVTSTIIALPCGKNGEQNSVAVELIRVKEKLKARMENGKPKIRVEIEGEGNVAEVECSELDLSKTGTITVLEKKTNENVEKRINQAIQVAQEKHKVDIFGFGDVVHRESPKYWKKVEDHWDEVFVGMETEVKVDIKLRRTGTVGDSFLNEMKKEK
ncbi:Ger(x)C family spore germination protein [Ammoniphilus sp. YIM 78166]|uniref:Ger(x)C family spore germination protein n=1 Tax=Ammoniphilus sp. YIM 78166 TaxID=1644106 RepID=UPI00106FB3D2|nr:Ger(x)C family spore germination protein [Ammoniphilus sp. YIM 78166]